MSLNQVNTESTDTVQRKYCEVLFSGQVSVLTANRYFVSVASMAGVKKEGEEAFPLPPQVPFLCLPCRPLYKLQFILLFYHVLQ